MPRRSYRLSLKKTPNELADEEEEESLGPITSESDSDDELPAKKKTKSERDGTADKKIEHCGTLGTKSVSAKEVWWHLLVFLWKS